MKTWMSELFLSISLLEILIIGIILKNYEEPLGNKEPEESTDHQLWIHGYICWEGSCQTDIWFSKNNNSNKYQERHIPEESNSLLYLYRIS